MNEIEVKFLITRGMADALWPRLRASGLTFTPPHRKLLKNVYLDTRGHALSKAGMALRLRHDGDGWVQTVKIRQGLHGGLAQANEVEAAAPNGVFNLAAFDESEIRDRIGQLIEGEPLETICEIAVDRTITEISTGEGRAELAVDAVKLRAGKRRAAFTELEIEFRQGTISGLYEIARRVMPEGGFEFSQMSKSTRGYRLAAGEKEAPPGPRPARPVSIIPAAGPEEAARVILRECFDQIADNLVACRKTEDIEGPHQLRVGLRRLRCALSVLGPVLPKAAALRSEARWLGRHIGKLRDIDVVAREIVPAEVARHPEVEGLTALANALTVRAEAQREVTRQLLAGDRVQAFLIDLAGYVETLSSSERPEAESLEQLASQSTARLWRKASKLATNIEALDEKDRHKLRKRLKDLRYASEFFAPLFPKASLDRFLKGLRRLQIELGTQTDAETVSMVLMREQAAGLTGPVSDHAIGWLVGVVDARAELARSRSGAGWHKIAQAAPWA